MQNLDLIGIYLSKILCGIYELNFPFIIFNLKQSCLERKQYPFQILRGSYKIIKLLLLKTQK